MVLFDFIPVLKWKNEFNRIKNGSYITNPPITTLSP